MQPLNRSYLWALCCLLSLTASAQENYQDGYVVFSGKDTVKGRIDFREWVINPNQIAFKDAASGKKTGYSPVDISAFAVGGDVYRTHTVRIYPYARDASEVNDEYATAAPHDTTVFLRLLTGGKLNLYSYFDALSIIYFFVQRSGTIPEQLQIRTSAVQNNNNGQPSMATQDLYKGQLAGMLTDCPAVVRKTANVAYSENALHKLIFAYNNCGKDTVEAKQADAGHGKSIRVEPLVGGFHTPLHVTGAPYSQMNWPGYSSVTGGVGVLGILPRSRQQFSFFADVLYSHFNSLSSTVNSGYGLYQFAQLTYDQAQLDLMFRYRYPMSSIRPFLNIGICNSLIFNNKSYLEYYGSGNPVTKEPLYGSGGSMKSLLTSILGGVGVEVRRFTIEARIYRTNGLSNVNGYNFTPTSYVLLVGFSL